MWTSRVISLSRSRWSNFPITYTFEDVVCIFEVQIEAEHLSLNYIPESNQERHDIILSLHWHKYTPAEIADYLNQLGMKSPRGGEYYPELVGVTRDKLLKRHKRRQKVLLKVSELSFGYFY